MHRLSFRLPLLRARIIEEFISSPRRDIPRYLCAKIIIPPADFKLFFMRLLDHSSVTGPWVQMSRGSVYLISPIEH
jgi:hypothetical protein